MSHAVLVQIPPLVSGKILVDRYSSFRLKRYLGAVRGGGSVVLESHSWEGCTDAAEHAFFLRMHTFEAVNIMKRIYPFQALFVISPSF